MDRRLLLFAAFALAAVAVTAQDMKNYGDELWSSETPSDELGLDPSKGDSHELKDYPFYDDDSPVEPELDVMLNKKSEEMIDSKDEKAFEEKDDTAGNVNESEDAMDNYADQSSDIVDKLPQTDWEQSRREQDLDGEFDENFDGYQIEDNRFDAKKEVPLEKQSNFPENEDNEPSDDVSDELNYPEFAGNLNNKNKEPLDVDQIVAETKNILEEEKSDFEEDIENKNLVSTESKNSEINESIFNDNLDDGPKNDFFDDIIENQLNEEIESYINEMDDKQPKINENDSGVSDENEDPEKDPDDYDFDIPDNKDAEPDNTVLKYENDMIDREETKIVNDNSNDDSDTNHENYFGVNDENEDPEKDPDDYDFDIPDNKDEEPNNTVLKYENDMIDREETKIVNDSSNDDSDTNYENDPDANDEDEDPEKDPNDYDFDVPNDKYEKVDNTVLKYENDMIDPEETETANDSSNDDFDKNFEVEITNDSEKETNGDDEEETVDKVYKDLDADLNKLFRTWDKIISDDSEREEDSIEEYEETFGIPYREAVVLQQRDEFYADVDDDDIVQKSDSNNEDTVQNNNKSPKLEMVKPQQLPYDLTNRDEKEDYPADFPAVSIALKKENEVSNKEESSKVTLASTKGVTIEKIESEEKEDYPDSDEIVEDHEYTPTKSIDIDDLNEQQYTELMKQFEIYYKTDTEELEKNIAPIHMTLVNNETLEITSPNYPGIYPTNNIVDWIIEGDGEGIELNITDLKLRGPQGDYLLIRPGGINEDSQGGLLFSYHLTQPNLRYYRFTDVSRIFVRFYAGTGLNFLTGFRMKVKMIWPPTPIEDNVLPNPEPLLPPPPATMTVNLGGLMYPYFKDVQESFRRLVADMATMYINANTIDEGLNTTSETAQITNVASCNVNWPNFLECVHVTFGVPLVYEDGFPEDEARLNQDDLIKMWTTYANQDPFAARLRAMGITEFDAPNDSHVMLAWVVLACGAVIAAAMLAFALWRYSCFQDYTRRQAAIRSSRSTLHGNSIVSAMTDARTSTNPTIDRMKDYGDTDSLREEKRGHDLYPTPHQPLPALYSDNDYKWADAKYDDSARVDLSGFANNSYARDELLEIETDEEAVAQRDRFTTDV